MGSRELGIDRLDTSNIGPLSLDECGTGRRRGPKVLDDVVIASERPREGWSVVNEHSETVDLDLGLELAPELVRAGLAREVARLLQEARKSSGFEVSDRIRLVW